MLSKPKDAIDRIWRSLKRGNAYLTPDKLKGISFTINHIEADKIIIQPQNISINRNAFLATLKYLQLHQHTAGKQCEIRSNNNIEKAGPLCQASRRENGGVRCINYIIPILKGYGILDYDGNRPNTVWLKEVEPKYPYATYLNVRFPALSVIDVSSLVSVCTDKWYNQTLCKVNDSVVRLGVMQGEYHWHKHDKDDEFFFLLEGLFIIDLKDESIALKPHQGYVVPKGVVHRTRAPERSVILLVENAAIIPTGDA